MNQTDRSDDAKPTLRVYIAEHCPVCRETLRVVEKIRRLFSRVDVEVIDLEAEGAENPDGVFSVPTYVLEGRTVSLGNPDVETFGRTLSRALAEPRRRSG